MRRSPVTPLHPGRGDSETPESLPGNCASPASARKIDNDRLRPWRIAEHQFFALSRLTLTCLMRQRCAGVGKAATTFRQ